MTQTLSRCLKMARGSSSLILLERSRSKMKVARCWRLLRAVARALALLALLGRLGLLVWPGPLGLLVLMVWSGLLALLALLVWSAPLGLEGWRVSRGSPGPLGLLVRKVSMA